MASALFHEQQQVHPSHWYPHLAGTYTVDYVKPMTANMIAAVPVILIYILFERQIVEGIAMSGVKG